MKRFVKENFPLVIKLLKKLKNFFVVFSKKSYAQFGEDVVLSTFLNEKKIVKGFYVDIGAYQPKKFSNTFFYYKKGWKGINIDAKPGSMELFKRERKRDINLELGVSNEKNKLDFYIFSESAYNTFSKDLVDSYVSRGILFNKQVIVETLRLEHILDKYLPIGQKIDFMSIDVEGLDLEVLESNNWNKYKPNYILIEMYDTRIEKIQKSTIYNFLINKGYRLVSIVYITLIFEYEL
ncbi:SAM-dependent methyltransferase [Candidatus Falkowbacteria bacterium CG10_big_fil_rev_8_21_14_0_10_37_18]|uniref:SAM-dependent methyltransferase n=1 Tax=Candidatus Falkowbacteria bacterium CG10_big_fil_rev_8_21_14_0_10_37_18 TaxID=1974562 RepID=A0A2H0V9N2_9BACT|nr:FkbM family methyltransferase [Candidatus Falkowbacteria bacterium]OIO06414.1 MAG: hypothetical protein AUJ26_00715 [Candidatus Falkowbacteria bacterium CG1_02_37_21]PIR95808.1 MAG: SAM-dependent methyltransferase [Candidatus Falkowbacteria bacterium CG10_big_fil_rev_8_21_14_0_10_37_18]